MLRRIVVGAARGAPSIRRLSIDAAVSGLVRKELAALTSRVATLEREVEYLRSGGASGATKKDKPDSGGVLEALRQVTPEAKEPPLQQHQVATTQPATNSAVPILWHNPACAESCKALALLEARGTPFEVRDYLDEPPDFAELSSLRRQLNLEPIEWARTLEPAWCEHFVGISMYDDLLPDDDDILRAMVLYPAMIDRPILTCGTRAVIGKPPERILALLDDGAAAGGA